MVDEVTGFASGAAMGAKFGPVGIFAGGVLGTLLGRSAKRKRVKEEARILKENTTTAFEIGEGQFANVIQGREDIATDFARGMSSARARFGASGAQLTGGAWEQVTGSLALQRDESLAGVQTEEDKFYASEAYKFIEKDFDYMSGVGVESRMTEGAVSFTPTTETYSISREGRSGENLFSEAQAENMRTFTSVEGGDETGRARYEEYRQAIMPTQEQYIASRFGSEEDQARYESDTNQRIERANEEYDSYQLQQKLIRAQQSLLNQPVGGAYT